MTAQTPTSRAQATATCWPAWLAAALVAALVTGLLAPPLAGVRAGAVPSGDALPQATAPGNAPATGATIALLQDEYHVAAPRNLALRGVREHDAAVLIRALLEGPTPAERANGVTSAFPTGTTLAAALVEGDGLTVQLDFPAGFLATFDAETAEEQVEQVLHTFQTLNFARITLAARGEDGAYRPLSEFLGKLPPPIKTVPFNDDTGGRAPILGEPAAPAAPGARPTGPLTGKTIYVSAGHGWVWSSTNQRWYTQRPPYQAIVEDHENAEAVNWYLLEYLWNAGANVWPVRERDFNTQELIVDNDAGQPGYSETGPWTTSGIPGYGGGSYRYAVAASATTASATWTPSFTEAGRYAVYAWFVPGANRVPDAHYQVFHAGGVSEVIASQEVHGSTWRYLGHFYFVPGAGHRVAIVNTSGQLGEAVIADAMRFGGGVGTVDSGGGASGYPRWEEASLTYTAYQGFDITGENDVIVRPHYAEWEREPGDDPVYLSWHTNGFNGSARGTESYVHDTDPTPGSAELQDWIHGELIGDIRTAWDAGWIDRGQKSANLGEVRELSTMPGVLVELAFHDNPDDAAALKEPEFERLAARALAQGLVKYYAARDGIPVRLAPEPPTHLTVRNLGYGQVRVTWHPPAWGGAAGDPATSYKVYFSLDGRGWDDGREVFATQYTFTGLPAGQKIFVRASAVNAGGESLLTPVLTARHGNPAGSSVLLVNDFNLLARSQLVGECSPQPWLPDCYNLRMTLDRMNRFDYVIEHADALPAYMGFDSAQREAVLDGDVNLGDYSVVDWIAGLDFRYRNQGGVVSPVQAKLGEFLAQGGALFISGSEVAWDLVNNGHGSDFYRGQLHGDFDMDDAGTYQVNAAAEGIFAGLGPLSLDDGTHGTYHVQWPDQIAPYNGSSAILTYAGGGSGTAGIQFEGAYRVIVLGFPFETIYPVAKRRALMERALPWLLDQSPRLVFPLVRR